MQTARRRRTRWAIAASVLAHVVLVVGVLLYRPHLTSPVELAAGPAETVIPVIMTPRRPAAAASARQVETQQAGRRAPSALIDAPPTPPQGPAAKVPPAVAEPPGPAVATEEGPDLRLALRHGAAGCANTATMSRDQRERCEDRLGAGLKTAPVMALAMEPRMRAYYDAVIKAKAPDKPWTPNRAIGALSRFDPEPRVSSSGDHLPGFGCFLPFSYGQKQTAKQKKAARKQALPHALWLGGPCFLEPPKGSLDPEVDVPVP